MSSTSDAARLRIERACRKYGPALTELFERVDCPCFCRYWDFPGDARHWQARCASGRELSRRELLEALPPEGDPASAPLCGLLALTEPEETCVGWMRLEVPHRMGKLYEGRLYRGLPCFSDARKEVLTVACFVVDSLWRHAGVATRLLEQGIVLAREMGAHALEAFPRRAENITDEEHWMGPPQLFERLGFVVVHEFGPYPVLRRTL